MDCTEKIILLLGFLFCFILSSNDVATQGQLRFFKLCKNWVYRRTVVSISIFDKGEEAQTILRDLDENAKYKIIEK